MRNDRLARVAREHVLAAARTMRAKDVYRWGAIVDIDGEKTEVLAKPLLMVGANPVNNSDPRVTPADLIPTAVRKLQKLGFEVVYHENPVQVGPPSLSRSGPNEEWQTSRGRPASVPYR